jgi:hypothetical protein
VDTDGNPGQHPDSMTQDVTPLGLTGLPLVLRVRPLFGHSRAGSG